MPITCTNCLLYLFCPQANFITAHLTKDRIPALEMRSLLLRGTSPPEGSVLKPMPCWQRRALAVSTQVSHFIILFNLYGMLHDEALTISDNPFINGERVAFLCTSVHPSFVRQLVFQLRACCVKKTTTNPLLP